ncbi:MAG: hypothetical protein KDA42_00555 [Planctomycetales bacterium]|nr:hypothetical protein [Planctomycetales bacterium]
MDQLEKQVAIAWRRLLVQKFFRRLPWCLCGTLLVALAATAVPKIRPMEFDSHIWAYAWIGGAAALACLIAGLWTYFTRGDRLLAAIEIDRRFELRERISSVLSLNEADLQTAAGQALAADATRRAERIAVSEQFRVSMDRRAWLPLVPALLAFVVAIFVPDAQPDQSARASTTTPETRKQIKNSAEVLKRKLADRRKEAQMKGLKEAEDFLRKVEQGTETLTKQGDVDKKQALVKLNDLAKELEKKKGERGDVDQLQKQFGALKDINKGPADKLLDAMKDGDMNKAQNELKKLQQQLANNDLNEQQQRELAQQMEQMQQKLAEAIKKHDQAKKDLEKQVEQAKAAGDEQKQQQLQQQLDRLNQQAPQMDQLKQMCDKLGQAAQAMKQGNAQQAQQQLDSLAQDLKQMQQEMDEMEMLDDALDQIADARDAMGCKQCQGEGCKACQGQGMGQGQRKGDRPGNGLGEGQGQGARPENENQIGLYDSKVASKPEGGKIVVTGEVDGPNRKGDVREVLKSELEASKKEASDPLEGTRLPKKHQDHAREYFDSFRDGK